MCQTSGAYARLREFSANTQTVRAHVQSLPARPTQFAGLTHKVDRTGRIVSRGRFRANLQNFPDSLHSFPDNRLSTRTSRESFQADLEGSLDSTLIYWTSRFGLPGFAHRGLRATLRVTRQIGSLSDDVRCPWAPLSFSLPPPEHPGKAKELFGRAFCVFWTSEPPGKPKTFAGKPAAFSGQHSDCREKATQRVG